MQFVLAVAVVFAAYALQSRYVTPHLDRWIDDSAPYWKKLAGVFITVVLFVLTIIALPGAVIGLTGGGFIKAASWRKPIAVDAWLWGMPKFATILGLMGVAVRIGHDLLLQFLRADRSS